MTVFSAASFIKFNELISCAKTCNNLNWFYYGINLI